MLKMTPGLVVPSGLSERLGKQLRTRVIQELAILREKMAEVALPNEQSEGRGQCRGSDQSTAGDKAVLRQLDEANMMSGQLREVGIVAVMDMRGLDDEGRRDADTDDPSESPEPSSEFTRLESLDIPVFPLRTMFPVNSYSSLVEAVRETLASQHPEPERAEIHLELPTSTDPDIISPTRGCASPSADPGVPPTDSTTRLAENSTPATDLTEPHLATHPDTPASTGATTPRRASPFLGISTWPSSPPDSGGQGDLGVDLAIALWRLRCWHGHGWEEFQVDRAGKRVLYPS